MSLVALYLVTIPSCSAITPQELPDTIVPDGVEITAYDPHVDYMERMISCAQSGTESDLVLGAIYEQQRNLKIRHSEIDDGEQTAHFTSYDPLEVQDNLGLLEPDEVLYYSEADVQMLAKVAYCEARGIQSKTEIACVMWTILNRVDAGYASTIAGVITAPNQFAYRASAPTVSDHGYDLVALARDVLTRWNAEKNGDTGSGRVLPAGYCWYSGNGSHNYFRNAYSGGTRWNYAWGYLYD